MSAGAPGFHSMSGAPMSPPPEPSGRWHRLTVDQQGEVRAALGRVRPESSIAEVEACLDEAMAIIDRCVPRV